MLPYRVPSRILALPALHCACISAARVCATRVLGECEGGVDEMGCHSIHRSRTTLAKRERLAQVELPLKESD